MVNGPADSSCDRAGGQNIECVTRAAAAWGIAQAIDAAEAGYLFSCGMNVFPEGPTPVI